jgi:trehalose/maltose hydrolase-like predicted phosphorylase
MGPDEYHEKYPGSREEGLRNNAYTNVMVAWICETAGKVLELLPERRREALCAKLGLTQEEISLWEKMMHKMFVPFHGDGLISQFEGYEALEELDWDAYRAKYTNIQRLDRILKAEGDTPDRWKLAKQADTLMLFFLFREERLERLFSQLGYEYRPDTAARNIAYYSQRTSHGSTLSYIVHAGVEADLEPQSSWDMFIGALESDVGDIQGGTTKEGIHMGVMAGTLDLIQRAYLGTEISEDVLYFKPKLIDKLDGLVMPMQFRQTAIEVRLEGGELTISPQTYGLGRTIKVGVNGEVREIPVGESHTFILPSSSQAEPQSVAVGGQS